MQGYSGAANWEVIGQAKRAVKIPVLANGDIFSPELAVQALKTTGADGILIARGALGNPWIFAQTQAALAGQTYRPVTMQERVRLVKKHAEMHCDLHGERGIVTFRKHLSWYFKGQPGAKKIREQLVRVSSLKELSELLNQINK
jgi:tRNA-dihydrouridine synthase